MLNFYFGEEDFLIQQAIKKTKEDFIQKNPQALVEFFDGEEDEVEDDDYDDEIDASSSIEDDIEEDVDPEFENMLNEQLVLAGVKKK
jgi:phosphopantothenoylcysteine synthetase/decarboxylase